MIKELQDKLISNFPLLYSDITSIDTPDKWFDILWELSEKIEEEIKNFISEKNHNLNCRKCGITQILHEAYGFGGCNQFQADYPRAIQVKEKFSLLRFYMSCSYGKIDKHIKTAEAKISIMVFNFIGCSRDL